MPCFRHKSSDGDWSISKRRSKTSLDAPVLRPESTQHIAQLAAHFPYRGSINMTEHRAITVGQLRGICEFLKQTCTSWHDTASPTLSRTSGQALAMEILNLYHVNEWLIKPAATEYRCSFVEHVTHEKQSPEWYLSHWWGTLVKSFTACVQEHARLRGLLADDKYWICAYANRQHCIEEELHMDPCQTSFFKAMQLSQGVLLVLDERSVHGGPATPFTRIWCALELHVALEYMPSMLLDVATSGHSDGVHILTRNPTHVDTLTNPHDFEYAKATREASFPLEVISKGLTLELEKAEATKDSDRTHILNLLACRDLESPPLREHENYQRVNKMLRAFFAEVSWRQAVLKGTFLDLDLAAALSADTWRDSLRLDFTCCRGKNVDDDCINALSRGLSENLKELSLSFSFCSRITNEGVIILARRLPSSLETLVLDFTGCVRIGDAAFAALIRHCPPNLNTETSMAIFKDTSISVYNPLWDFNPENVHNDPTGAASRPGSPPEVEEGRDECCETPLVTGRIAGANTGSADVQDAMSPLSTGKTWRKARLPLTETDPQSDPASPWSRVASSADDFGSLDGCVTTHSVDDLAANSTRSAPCDRSMGLPSRRGRASSGLASWSRRDGIATAILSRIDGSIEHADRVIRQVNDALAPFQDRNKKKSTPSKRTTRHEFCDVSGHPKPRQLPPLRRCATMG
jgi:hypothetical protein